MRVSLPKDDMSVDEGQVPAIGSESKAPSNESTQPALASASTSAPTETAVQGSGDEPRDKDNKDKGSLSTTLTSRFSRRKANKSSSTDNAPSSSTHIEKSVAVKKSKTKVYKGTLSKPSFFSRIARRLVPCTGPSSIHPNEVDDAASGTSGPGSSLALKEKQGPKDTEKESGPSQTTQANESSPIISPADTTSSLPLAISNPISVVTLTPADDEEVIIPPTKVLLPESETEGVTSGAVQAPGSTGEEILHDHTAHGHVSGNESDETGASDEEYEDANNMEDVEDEEDRLIRQGGAGIPIGLVSERL